MFNAFWIIEDEATLEDRILDSLGPRDLVRAKMVCKGWATAVRRYIREQRISPAIVYL